MRSSSIPWQIRGRATRAKEEAISYDFDTLRQTLDEFLPHIIIEWECSQPACGETHSRHDPECARCKFDTALANRGREGQGGAGLTVTSATLEGWYQLYL